MRRFFVFLALSLLVQTGFADLRDSVCVVQPMHSEKQQLFFNKLSVRMEEDGYTDISKAIKDMESFGSGFFYYKNNMFYVITNSHVVADAEFVRIILKYSDGSEKKIEKCSVIAINDDFDLALISVPDWVIKNGLKFSDKKLQDGDEVWAAGYPGLGGEPSWQLGRGNITNSSAWLKDLVDTDKSFLIQHSAPADPGNSGGPLLYKPPSKTEYEVIGINTWKAIWRQSTNFAIPAVTIEKFILTATSAYSTLNEEQAHEMRIKDYVALLTKPNESTETKNIEKNMLYRVDRLARIISVEYAMSNEGLEAIRDVLRTAPSVIMQEVVAMLARNPIVASKLALAYKLYKKIQGSVESYVLPEQFSVKTLKDNTLVLGGDAKTALNTVWVVESKSFRIAGVEIGSIPGPATEAGKNDTDKSKEAVSTSGFSLKAPYNSLIFMDIAFSGQNKGQWLLGLFYTYNFKFVGIGTGVSFTKIDTSSYFSSTIPKITARLQIQLRAHVPMRFSGITLSPYVLGRFGYQLLADSRNMSSGTYANFGIGMELSTNKRPAFVSFIGYMLQVGINNTGIVHMGHIGLGFGL